MRPQGSSSDWKVLYWFPAIPLIIFLLAFLTAKPDIRSAERGKLSGITGTNLVQGDGLTLQYSKNELIEPASISISEAENVPWGSIRAFELSPSGLEFAEPAKVSIDADSVSLPPGINPTSLRLAYLDSGKWRIIEGSGYSAESGEVRGSIEHFSTYGIIPEADEINKVGTLFELNGISILASEEVYMRLSVTPELVTASLTQKPGRTVNLTLSGLPTSGSHYIGECQDSCRLGDDHAASASASS